MAIQQPGLIEMPTVARSRAGDRPALTNTDLPRGSVRKSLATSQHMFARGDCAGLARQRSEQRTGVGEWSEPDAPGFLDSLTPRERQVADLVAAGLANKEIAWELRISVRTVEAHRSHIMSKSGARTGAHLVQMILLEGGVDSQHDRRKLERLAESLSPRQRQLMSAVVNGDQNKEVASKLGISERTVEVHRSRMMSRMGVDSLAGLVRAGVILGLVSAERGE